MAKKTVMRPVTGSSNIQSIGYQEEKSKLTIQFHNGNHYTYKPFSADAYKAFLAAESKGKHFFSHIKNNKSLEVNKLN